MLPTQTLQIQAKDHTTSKQTACKRRDISSVLSSCILVPWNQFYVLNINKTFQLTDWTLLDKKSTGKMIHKQETHAEQNEPIENLAFCWVSLYAIQSGVSDICLTISVILIVQHEEN